MSFSICRTEAGFSLDDVCREFGVSSATVQEWEEGKTRPPARVARTLDVIGRMSKSKTPEGIKPRQPEFAATRDEGPLFKPKDLIKSKQRVADHGEVFTPPWLVEKMLDLVKGETERIDSRFLEPACGSGNFLVPILQRKLAAVEAKYGKAAFDKKLYALQALACCYGIELLADNISECRANMLGVFAEYLGIDDSDDFYRAASHVLSLNLVQGDAMKMTQPDGSPIMIVEWSYLGKAGKFNRRDFRLEVLTRASGFNERWAAPDTEQKVSLFAEPRPAFHHRGHDPIFVPMRSHPPMTARQMAALDGEAVA